VRVLQVSAAVAVVDAVPVVPVAEAEAEAADPNSKEQRQGRIPRSGPLILRRKLPENSANKTKKNGCVFFFNPNVIN
jgi:hypothetical protein